MILPVYAYGQPVLKRVGEDIDKDYEGLSDLLTNMWETRLWRKEKKIKESKWHLSMLIL